MASAQTSKETRQPLDFYPTPEFYTRALLENYPLENMYRSRKISILFPFVGDGAIPRELLNYVSFFSHYNDLHDYGFPLNTQLDLSDPVNRSRLPQSDYVIDNPPYNLLSLDLIQDLYDKADIALCLLLRQTWYSAGTGQTGVSDRGRWLSGHPASMRITLPRYPFANNSKTGKPQTDACAHEWVIWDKTGKVFPVQNPVVTSETLEGWKWRKA